MNSQTLEKLRQMRFYGMYDAFKTSLENTLKEQMTGGSIYLPLSLQ